MYSEFFNTEFIDLKIKDVRLIKRAKLIGNRLIRSPGSCIQEIFDEKNEARCAYDFFGNPKVKWGLLLNPHQDQTIQRIHEEDAEHIFVIQDSTFYNYTNHSAKIDMGVIGKQGRFTQLGLLQHTALCISQDEKPLGIIALDFIGYDDDPKDFSYRQGYDDLASSRWRRFSDETKNKLQHADKKVILLCDREADFFEFLSDFKYDDEQFKFVIRSKWDRSTGKSARTRQNKLSSLFEQKVCLGKDFLQCAKSDTHEEISLKALEDVLLPPIHRGAGHPQNNLPPIRMNVVEASGIENKWTLLTNLPVNTLEEVKFVVESYKKRWHIESFHKVLKTAYKAEQIYLHNSREAIQNLTTMINIASVQTYWLIHQARHAKSRPANSCFQKSEIEALHVYYYHKKLENINSITLEQVYFQIARLGGHKNANNKHPPGILTIYRGIKKLTEIKIIYEACMSIKT
ncbi:TPA: IS4 family transposase [Legionella pneumophila]|nr:IS4 family transposase [Legionella pneumophila]